jgi:uncharacterized ferritin-like protein (DUF455 family)
MIIRDYALGIVTGTTLAAKLAPPPASEAAGSEANTDREPALRIAAPGRPPELPIVPGRQARVPPIEGMRDPAQRVRILHALANHELQAIELFAWALLAFPDAPPAFRRGLVAILADEQKHLALYIGRMGCAFGTHPVTGYFWSKLDHMTTPVEFACAMGLTFEQANLDFAGDYAAAARACGDIATADVLDQVHADEIRHVHFGWVWLRRFAGETDAWTAYNTHVHPPLGPARARGARLDVDARRRAGIDEAFIAELERVAPTRPSGQPR